MTIAACYVSPEGVVLGADSTSTFSFTPGDRHYFNNGQKLFEIGEDSTLGIVTWGLGGLVVGSHRRMVAQLADELAAKPAAKFADVVDRWIDLFWPAYSSSLSAEIAQCKQLHSKPPHDPNASQPDPNARTEQEEEEYQQLRLGLPVGFCIGGYVLPDRTPAASVVVFDPLGNKPTPRALPANGWEFWGAPNMIQRLIFHKSHEVFTTFPNLWGAHRDSGYNCRSQFPLGTSQALGCGHHRRKTGMSDKLGRSSSSQTASEPEWVRQMHTHVNRTGEYRPKDLERVLGDPRKGVTLESTGDLAPSNRAKSRVR